MNVIIPRNTTIPAKAGELFTNAVANQSEMDIRILQGEREMAQDNWELGRITIPFPPGSKGSARIGVQFSIDENGILNVLSRDTSTGSDHVLEITNSAVDVDDERVEAMISESICGASGCHQVESRQSNAGFGNRSARSHYRGTSHGSSVFELSIYQPKNE